MAVFITRKVLFYLSLLIPMLYGIAIFKSVLLVAGYRLATGCTPPPATYCILFPITYYTAQLYVPQHPPYGQTFPTISSSPCPSHSHLIPSQAAVPCPYFMINSTFLIQSAGGQQIRDLRVDHTTTY